MFISKISVSKIMRECHIDHYNSYPIKNDVYYVETNYHNYIIKMMNFSLFRKVIDYIKRGRYLAFINEINFYKSLEYKEFQLFHYPRLIHTDGRSYMVLEYIAGTKGWDREIITQRKFIKALLELQLSRINIKKNLIQNILTNWYRKVPSKVIRWSFLMIKSPQDIVTALKCIAITLKNTMILQKYPYSILIHNDLFYFNNIITGIDQKLYFYDFEYVIEENKWILTDIIDLCFDLLTLTFDSKLFAEYMMQLSRRKTLFRIAIKNVYGQVRVILIRKVIGVLLSNSTQSEQKLECIKFLKKVLLSERDYISWYRLNIHSDIQLYQTGDYRQTKDN